MTHYWTTAPASYDYPYVTEVSTKTVGTRTYRLVETTDIYRFTNFQKPRYLSGFHSVFAQDDELATMLGLV